MNSYSKEDRKAINMGLFLRQILQVNCYFWKGGATNQPTNQDPLFFLMTDCVTFCVICACLFISILCNLIGCTFIWPQQWRKRMRVDWALLEGFNRQVIWPGYHIYWDGGSIFLLKSWKWENKKYIWYRIVSWEIIQCYAAYEFHWSWTVNQFK